MRRKRTTIPDQSEGLPSKDRKIHKHPFVVPVVTFILLSFLTLIGVVMMGSSTIKTDNANVVQLTVDGEKQTLPTRAGNVGDFLERAGIPLEEGDVVEPTVDESIEGDNFRINVYRARQVAIFDGEKRIQALSAATTPRSVAMQVGIEVYPEDNLKQEVSSDLVRDQIIGEKIVIERATPINLNLYGTQAVVRTHANTVSELLKEKNVSLASGDSIQPAVETPITANMQIFITRSGTQIVTVEEQIPMPIERIQDNSLSIGSKAIRQQGSAGKRFVTYQINLVNGVEVSRSLIQTVEVAAPVKQIEAIGSRSIGGLSKSKGVYFFTDSNGVTHRETYYDLVMSSVAGHCGNGGKYTVREDGAKVDKDGYILVAANLSIYPRCSVVETSLGLAKVYDTGGFASTHPHGFDLATDWTNNDGR